MPDGCNDKFFKIGMSCYNLNALLLNDGISYRVSIMDVLKTVLDYIKENHPEAAVPLEDYSCFTVSSAGKSAPGYSRSVYSGGGWNVSIGRPVTREIIYNVRAEYNNGDILWVGRILNGKVEENGYENSSCR